MPETTKLDLENQIDKYRQKLESGTGSMSREFKYSPLFNTYVFFPSDSEILDGLKRTLDNPARWVLKR